MTVSLTDPSPMVDVITSVPRCRRWSAAEKVRMVEETYAPDASVSSVARQHGVHPNQFFSWRRPRYKADLAQVGCDVWM